jgi:FKBP-type peptidyl-prolyl cis-trans isomerase 2
MLMEMMYMRYVALLVVLALMLGCISTPPASNLSTNSSNPTVITNGSTNPNGSLVQPTVAALGDHVWVNYTLRVDGKVYDTNNATLANESGIYNPQRAYTPLDFDLVLNKGIIDGFVLDIINMHVGETLNFQVDPKRGYGPYDPTKIVVIPRYYNKSLTEVVPRAYFTDRNITIANGTSFDSKYGVVFVQNMDQDNVTIRYMINKGQDILVNGVPQIVANITNDTAVMEFGFEINKTYNLPNPDTGAANYFKVLDKTAENITLDGNHALANKTLDFQVTLLKIERPS